MRNYICLVGACFLGACGGGSGGDTTRAVTSPAVTSRDAIASTGYAKAGDSLETENVEFSIKSAPTMVLNASTAGLNASSGTADVKAKKSGSNLLVNIDGQTFVLPYNQTDKQFYLKEGNTEVTADFIDLAGQDLLQYINMLGFTKSVGNNSSGTIMVGIYPIGFNT